MLAYQKDCGMPPTIKQIGIGVGIAATSVTYYHLLHLLAEGRVENKPRGEQSVYWAKEI